MLAQHMVTRPVFEALHGDSTFVDQNPISKGMQLVLDVLKPAKIESEAESLDEFYASVARRAKAANTPLARQKIITELYDKFFRNAFPKTAARLGIVYTPIEIVDFILHSVDEVLRNEFGESLSSEGVEILDPFTGTGTFITRMLQNDLIDPEALPRKYRSEIHANEIMLLAYYIAAVNIEDAYHAIVGTDSYERFSGIILTDTFEMQDSPDLIADILPENSEQRKRQKESQIRVIVGNPPWSAGQKDENDAAQNQSYPILLQRIENSYAYYSSAKGKMSLRDSYIQAIRWASDRIGKTGVIGFVTNAGWLDTVAMDGMRKCLVDEFSSIYVLNLRGNARSQGDKRRAEGGNAFGGGSRAPVAITLLVKNPERTGCTIRYYDIGDYLSREEKLNQVKAFKGISGLEEQWVEIQPDAHHDWLNQRKAGFGKFMALGDKKSPSTETIFKNYSQGVKTNRDAWCYNYSETLLRMNIQTIIRFYENERQRLLEHDTQGRRLTALEITNFVNNDSTKISWTVNVKDDLAKNKELSIDEGRFTVAQYRPFTKTHMFLSRRLNERVYQMPQIFPHEEAENRVICVTGRGNTGKFSCLFTKHILDLNSLAAGAQCFPRWIYKKPDEKGNPEIFDSEIETDSNGYVRENAIHDSALHSFQEKMGGSITHDDLFYFIYGVLHVPSYREKYAANLQKELPRIPLTNDAQQFWMLTNAGRKLAEFHVHYDEVDPWPIHFEKGGWDPDEGISYEKWFRVEKMKHPRKAKEKDLSQIVYNDFIMLKDIPVEAYDYMVNGKSAIAWVMERQGVKIDKKSQIVNDANRFAIETMKDPAYPLRLLARVITVSMETIKIVDGLRDIEFSP
ncbi:MAG: N-6 DNA methylase [Rhodobacteraceae bacterium]|nr:N-6 DNA methylase [Paracoccaceae bacterium]